MSERHLHLNVLNRVFCEFIWICKITTGKEKLPNQNESSFFLSKVKGLVVCSPRSNEDRDNMVRLTLNNSGKMSTVVVPKRMDLTIRVVTTTR